MNFTGWEKTPSKDNPKDPEKINLLIFRILLLRKESFYLIPKQIKMWTYHYILLPDIEHRPNLDQKAIIEQILVMI